MSEALFDFQVKAAKLPAPEPEHRFHPTRKWRFDRAWTDRKLAVEIEGGTWVKGRHVRPKGFAADCEKYNEAALLGWRVLRFTTEMVKSGEALAMVERAMREADAQP